MAEHRIEFPSAEDRELHQDKEYFYLLKGESKEKIRLHDYSRVFGVPGLYEHVVQERLACCSPAMVVDVLVDSMDEQGPPIDQLRVLELGAGNGLVGDELKKYGVAKLVAADINPDARAATERDRPGVYDAYHVMDFANLRDEERDLLLRERFNAFVCVSALGFAAPTSAFSQAFNLVHDGGWVAFNIKDSFLDQSDESGFSKMIRGLFFSDSFEVVQLKRYRHRLSMGGEPLYYYVLTGRKKGAIQAA